MRRRGRPPFPDILTPRQWEVLELLRRGLSDQQIADELGVTLAGAKYHVSEILTKLNVSSREQAAAWQPDATAPRDPWWRRTLGIPLALKLTAAVVMVAAASGLGLLAYGVAQSGDGEASSAPSASFDDLHLPAPAASPVLTKEQAIFLAAFLAGSGQFTSAQADLTTVAGVNNLSGGFEPQATQNAARWYIRYRGYDLTSEYYGPCCQPAQQPGLCYEGSAFLNDALSPEDIGSWFAGSEGGSPVALAECQTTVNADAAVLIAAQTLSQDIILQQRPPDSVTVEEMSYEDAQSRIPGLVRSNIENSERVWLVTIKGRFFTIASPTPVPESPPPSVLPPCNIRTVLVSATGGIAFPIDSSPC